MGGEEEMRSRARGGEKRRRTKGNTDEADTEQKMAEKKHHTQTQTQGCALPPFVCCTLTLSLSLFPPNTHTHTLRHLINPLSRVRVGGALFGFRKQINSSVGDQEPQKA